jgi:hypothetical protein
MPGETPVIANINLRTLLLVAVVAVFGSGTLMLLTSVWSSRCSSEITESLGPVDSKETALCTSIQKLSAEVGRCPATEIFRVMWMGPDAGRHAILYDRTHKVIGYEDDFLSGISSRPYYADDAAVRTVAEKGGSLEDFVLYERRSR